MKFVCLQTVPADEGIMASKQEEKAMSGRTCNAIGKGIVSAIFVCSLVSSHSVLSALVGWTGGGDGTTWSDGLNWGGAVPGSGDDVQFPSGSGTTINVDVAPTVGSMRIFDTYVYQNNPLIINPSNYWRDTYGVDYDIYTNASGVDIQSNVQLQGDVVIFQNAQSPAVRPKISGNISDDGNARKLIINNGNQLRPLELSGTNTYTGGTELRMGALWLTNNSSIGSGPFTVAGDGTGTGAPYVHTTVDVTLSNDMVIEDSWLFNPYYTTGGSLTINGDVSLAADNVRITERDGNSTEKLSFNGVISETGGTRSLELEPLQGGWFRLGSANQISGGISIRTHGTSENTTQTAAAVIELGDPGALGSGPVTIRTNGIDLRGLIFVGDSAMSITQDVVLDNSGGRPVMYVGNSSTGGFNSPLTWGGTISGTGNIVVRRDSTFASTGAFTGTLDVNRGATLAVGNSPGALEITGNLELGGRDSAAGDARFVVTLTDPTPGTGYTQVKVNGTVDLSADTPYDNRGTILNVNLENPKFQASDLAFIIVNDGTDPVIDIFTTETWGDTIAEGELVTLGTVFGQPATAQISYLGNAEVGALTGGNDIVLYNFTNAFVPEPSTFAVVLLGLGCMMRRRT